MSSGTSVPSPGRACSALTRTGLLWWFVGQCSARDRYPAAAPTSRPRPPGAPRSTGSYAVEVLDSAPSTNAVVADRARQDDAPAGLVVVAEHQTAGRGRLDRDLGDAGPLGAHRVRCCSARTPARPLAVAAAADRARRPATPLPEATPTLKWPNDVLLGDRKVGRDPGRAGGDPGRPGRRARHRHQRHHDRRRAAGPDGDLARARGTRRRPHRPAARVPRRSSSGTSTAWSAGRIADAGLRAAYVEGCSTLGRDVRVDLPVGETVDRPAPSTSTRAAGSWSRPATATRRSGRATSCTFARPGDMIGPWPSPSKLLNEGEHVVVSTRTHPKVLLLPLLVLVLALAVAAFRQPAGRGRRRRHRRTSSCGSWPRW